MREPSDADMKAFVEVLNAEIRGALAAVAVPLLRQVRDMHGDAEMLRVAAMLDGEMRTMGDER